MPTSSFAELVLEQHARVDRGVCACGCGRPSQPGSKYASTDRCRQRAYLQRVNARAAALGVPAHLNLHVLGETADRRNSDAQKRAPRVRRRPPELRVSYLRAVDAVERLLARQCAGMDARRGAEDTLLPLLSGAARARAVREREEERSCVTS